MPVKLIHSPNYANNLSFSDYFQRQNRSIVLLTHFSEENSFYDRVNSLILEKFINLDLQSIDWEVLSDHLESFFNDLNWELNAQFRDVYSSEKGVSLLLVIVEGRNLCFVSLGRFLCGLFSENKRIELNGDWSNFRVKTKEQLRLLGSIEQDIHVKPQFVEMKREQQFVGFSWNAIEKSGYESLNSYNLHSFFSDQFKNNPSSYCIINCSSETALKKKKWFKNKRFRLTIFLMLLMLIFSGYYYFQGKNAVEDSLHVIREQFQLEVRNIDVLKIQELLPLDYGILLVPQRNLELFVEWESVIPFDVTLPPSYDLRQLYLASGNTVYAYGKRDNKKVWQQDFSAPVTSVEILDANLMIVSTLDKLSHCLKRDTGETVWQRITGPQTSKTKLYNPVQISLEMDRRLSNSIVLFPDEKSLTLLNILNGDTLFFYQSETSIDFISDFDFIEKALYLVKGRRLYKVRFDIRA